MMGHVSPEAALGGPIAAIRDGDVIHNDVSTRTIDVDVDPATLEQRLSQCVPMPAIYGSGAMPSTPPWSPRHRTVLLPIPAQLPSAK
jgi:dihydroxyacid dehydratase/phosphogluconate dehydratase